MKRIYEWWKNLPLEESRFIITTAIQTAALILIIAGLVIQLTPLK